MTNLINLGESPGATIALDLERLIETRLLVQAMSGGGKSWAIRRLCEQSYGQVQQIVLDLEGEFPTLRERFPDYVIASKGGAPQHPGWFHNLSAQPKVEIQVGRERIPVRARVAEGEERARLWARADEINQGQYAAYQSRTSRVIPVVVLERMPSKH